MIKKYVIVAIAFCLIATMFVNHVSAVGPPGTNPPTNYGSYVVDEGAGAFPATLDPHNCYDTASAEAIYNSYETLTFFLGEKFDAYIPMLAAQCVVGPPSTTLDIDTGEAAPAYTNFTVYYKINTGLPWTTYCRTDVAGANWGTQWYLTTDDVKYSFQRLLVHDYVGSATWMMMSALLDCNIAQVSDPTFGNKIDDAIQRNSTHVWLNFANSGFATHAITPFAPVKLFATDNGTMRTSFFSDLSTAQINYPVKILMQVMSQSWSAILSKQWIVQWVIPNGPAHAGANNPDWNGNFAAEDWTHYSQWASTESPLDLMPIGAATPGVMCTTGPYILDIYDVNTGWQSIKDDGYYGGWPAKNPNTPYPSAGVTPSGATPVGWVRRIVVHNDRGTAQRYNELISGDADIAAVSRSRQFNLHTDATLFGPLKQGIRLNYVIPAYVVESSHYTFIVDPNPVQPDKFGKIYANNTLANDGIPANFLNNSHVRKAFSYLTDFATSINTYMMGEAYQPATCAPNGIPYINPANPKWGPSPNYAKADYEFSLAQFNGINVSTAGYGFDIQICYYDAAGGNRENWCKDLAIAVNTLNATPYNRPYHATALYDNWDTIIDDLNAHYLPIFRIGWLADYVDMHDFIFPYGHSEGDYGRAQRLNDPTLDSLIMQAERTPDGPARQALYYAAELELYNYNPGCYIYIGYGRGYQRTWLNNWPVEYMPLYPGVYAYYLWKWDYIRGDADPTGVGTSSVGMGDINILLNAFGGWSGKNGVPGMHPRWDFHSDVDGDGNPQAGGSSESGPVAGYGGWRNRQTNMYDISAGLANFGGTKSIPQWQTGLAGW